MYHYVYIVIIKESMVIKMSHKLYTTYLSKMKDLPEGIVKAIIMRMPPMSIQNIPNTIHVPELSPKVEVLKAYKANNDFEVFREKFNEQMYTDEETMKYLNMLMEALDYNEVAIICCEKDPNVCHRSLIANYLTSLGYKCEEL